MFVLIHGGLHSVKNHVVSVNAIQTMNAQIFGQMKNVQNKKDGGTVTKKE